MCWIMLTTGPILVVSTKGILCCIDFMEISSLFWATNMWLLHNSAVMLQLNNNNALGRQCLFVRLSVCERSPVWTQIIVTSNFKQNKHDDYKSIKCVCLSVINGVLWPKQFAAVHLLLIYIPRGREVSFPMAFSSPQLVSENASNRKIVQRSLWVLRPRYTLKNFKWTGMAIPCWVRKYLICFSSEIYFLYWNVIHIFIKHFIFIWEWKTRRSKFEMRSPFSITIPVNQYSLPRSGEGVLLPKYLASFSVSILSPDDPINYVDRYIDPFYTPGQLHNVNDKASSEEISKLKTKKLMNVISYLSLSS